MGYPRGMPKFIPAFTPETIGREVNQGRKHRGIKVTRITDIMGMGRTHWYDKIDGTKPFSVEELGQLAAILGAPKGWPILTWAEAEEWEARQAELRGRRDEREQKPHH